MPFSIEEREETRLLVRKCFTGRGSAEDALRCAELLKQEPEEYTALAKTARAEVRDELRSW